MDEPSNKVSRHEDNGSSWVVRMYPFLPVLLLFVLAAALMNLPWTKDWRDRFVTKNNLEKSWMAHNEYRKNGKLLFFIAPDPQLSAGKSYNYMIHFTAPFKQFSGKMLAVTATHKDTGLKVTAMRAQKVESPSSGTDNLDRFVFSAGLPLSGIWKYEIELDGAFYGDAALQIQEPSWEVSPIFTAGAYRMRGIGGRIGFIEAGFRAARSNRYFWHFWGSDKELEGPVKIMAVKQETGEIKEVYSAGQLRGELNGADRTAVALMTLPSAGRWMLIAYINDRLFDHVVVEAR